MADGLGNVGQNVLLVVGTAVAAAAWTVSAYFNDDLDDDFEDAEEGSRRSLSAITWKDESGGNLEEVFGEGRQGVSGRRRGGDGGDGSGSGSPRSGNRSRPKDKSKGKGKSSKRKGGGGGAGTTLSLKSRSRSKSGSVSNLGALDAAAASAGAGAAAGDDTYTGKVLHGGNQGSMLPRNQHGMGADMVASPEWGFYVSITPDQAKYFASKSGADDELEDEET